jgi:hypothetical protein
LVLERAESGVHQIKIETTALNTGFYLVYLTTLLYIFISPSANFFFHFSTFDLPQCTETKQDFMVKMDAVGAQNNKMYSSMVLDTCRWETYHTENHDRQLRASKKWWLAEGRPKCKNEKCVGLAIAGASLAQILQVTGLYGTILGYHQIIYCSGATTLIL